MVTKNSTVKFLTDKALSQINASEFREKIGITKTDYRFLRNLLLRGINPLSITIWEPKGDSNKFLTLHQFCQKLRNIDVIYLTRIQKERV